MRVILVMLVASIFGFADGPSNQINRPSILINETRLYLPSIDDFSLTTDRYSKAYANFNLSTFPGNELFACYAPSSPSDPRDDYRKCSVQSRKSAENFLISKEDFKKGREIFRSAFNKPLEGEMQTDLDLVRKQIEKNSNEGGISLSNLKVGQTLLLETLSDDDYSYTVVITMKLIQSKDGVTEEIPTVGSCAILVCKGKLIYFYANSKFHDSSDITWVKRVTQKWTKDFFEINGWRDVARDAN